MIILAIFFEFVFASRPFTGTGYGFGILSSLGCINIISLAWFDHVGFRFI